MFIFLIFFILWFLSKSILCPCESSKLFGESLRKYKPKFYCNRLEFYGVQPSHLIVFSILGYVFPNNFIIIQLIGIIWELIEYIIDKNRESLLYIGGCLDKFNKFNKSNNKLIYKTVRKNIIL